MNDGFNEMAVAHTQAALLLSLQVLRKSIPHYLIFILFSYLYSDVFSSSLLPNMP